MRHKFLAALICTLLFFGISAQNQQKLLWNLETKQVPFNPGSGTPTTFVPHPSVFSNLGITPTYEFGYNCYHDVNGKVLFSIADGFVYDWEGRLIGPLSYSLDISNPSNALVRGTPEYCIIPVPCTNDKFYIVAGDYNQIPPNLTQGLKAKFYFSEITIGADININGSWNPANFPEYHGDPLADGVLTVNQNNSTAVFPYENSNSFPWNVYSDSYSVLIAASTPKQGSVNDERFLFIAGQSGIYVYNVQNSGLNFSHLIPHGYGGAGSRVEMECVQLAGGGYRLAVVDWAPHFGYSNTNTSVDIYTLDANGNLIGAIKNIISSTTTTPGPAFTPIHIKGIEFDPTGTYLYETIDYAPYIQYADLSLTNPAFLPIPNSSSFASQFADFKDGNIELAADNKLYFIASNRLASLNNINNPSLINPSTDWNNNALSINSTYAVWAGTIISGYNGANAQIYLLNDQIDGETYWSVPIGTDPLCCMQMYPYRVNTYTATTLWNGSNVQTWTPLNNPFGGAPGNPVSVVTVRDEIKIPKGFRITIQNMTFQFKPRLYNGTVIQSYGARVVIENETTTGSSAGGSLTLRNTKFTNFNYCKTGMWEGVEVWGNGSSPHTPIITSREGKFFTYQNSTVEHAMCGAFEGKKNASYSLLFPVANTSGGIIHGSGSTYRNCSFGVELFNFSPSSVCYFSGMTFKVDAALNEPNILPLAHCLAISHTQVGFNQCTFSNTVPTIYPQTALTGWAPYGIVSFNTQVNAAKNTFENLRYGMYSTSSSLRTVTATKNTFKNNYRGMYCGSLIAATITENKYNIFEYPLPSPEIDAAYGLYLDYSTGFKVEENNFHYNSFTGTPVAGQFNVFGLIVNESNVKRVCNGSQNYQSPVGYGGDEIYKNNFTELYFGSQIQGNNSETGINPVGNNGNPCYLNNVVPNNIGLKFYCNNYSGIDKYDIRLTDDLAGNHAGNWAYQQGFSNYPADNTFSHQLCPAPTTLTQNELFSDATFYPSVINVADAPNINNFDYYHSNATTKMPYCYTPFITGGYTGANLFMNTTQNTCKSKLSGPPLVKHIVKDVKTINAKLDSIKSKIAYGQSQALLNIITSGTKQQAVAVANNASPYLSDAALLALINKGLPNGQLKQILIDNSKLSATVMAAVNNLNLPGNIKQQIQNAQTGKTPSEEANELIAFYRSEKGYLMNEIIRFYVNDTTNATRIDSLIKEVKLLGGYGDNSIYIRARLAAGDTLAAKLELDSLTAKDPSNTDLVFLKTLIDIEKNPANIFAAQFDAVLMQSLIDKSNDFYGADRAGANYILKKVANGTYMEWIEPLHNQSGNRLADPNEKTVKNENAELIFYPNPTKDFLNISYKLNTGNENNRVVVYNMIGQEVLKQNFTGENGTINISLSNLENGIYHIVLFSGEKVIGSQKVSVQK